MNVPPRSAFGAPLQGGAASGPAKPDPRLQLGDTVGSSDLHRLKWRSRRGLLENDLFVERFFRRHSATLTERNAIALQALMELADPDLLDLFLARQEPQGALDCEAVHEVLKLIRTGSLTERQ